MDDSKVEVLEDSPGTPALPPIITMPRLTKKPKTIIRPGPKVPVATAEQPPGPQAIHPVESLGLPLSLKQLEKLKDILQSKTVSFLLFMFSFSFF